MPIDQRQRTYHFLVNDERKDQLLEDLKEWLKGRDYTADELDALGVWLILAASEKAGIERDEGEEIT